MITTVSAITDLYWDLVSFNENVRVKRDAMAASPALLRTTGSRWRWGPWPPSAWCRRQAEIASDQQALTVAETQLLQQETILKNALSRTGVLDPAIADARVIPTDTHQGAGR